MDVEPHDSADLNELRRWIRTERKAKQRDRYRVVLLALEGLTTATIVDKLDRSRPFVQKWVYRYRDEGLAGLGERPRPGQPSKLSRADEATFKARLDAGPVTADGICTLRGRDIQRILAREFGVQYSLPGAYDLLRRLGYSYLKPRPRHRKNDPEAMAQWKQAAPLLSARSKADTRTDVSKSGSKTRAASGSKAH